MFRWGIFLMALGMYLVNTNNANAQEVYSALKAEILEYGYYQPMGELERQRNYNTASGYIRTDGDVRLVKQTTEIPKALGRLFGFKFRIRGFPRDEVAVNLELVVSHPEIIRPNGTHISGYRYPVAMDLEGGKLESKTGYQFDKEYEMVEGEWRFQYWFKDQLLLEQVFNVVNSPSQQQDIKGDSNEGNHQPAHG